MSYIPVLLLFLLLTCTETLYEGPVFKPTVVFPVCTNSAHSGNVVFKAENNSRRVIVRSVNCWST